MMLALTLVVLVETFDLQDCSIDHPTPRLQEGAILLFVGCSAQCHRDGSPVLLSRQLR